MPGDALRLGFSLFQFILVGNVLIVVLSADDFEFVGYHETLVSSEPRRDVHQGIALANLLVYIIMLALAIVYVAVV